MKATLRYVTTFKMVPVSVPILQEVPVEEARINLELTEKQAQFVLDVMRCIGGDPDRTRRHISEDVQDALREFVAPQIAADIHGILICQED